MKVRLFATLRQVAGAKEVEVDLEVGETVRHALEKLVELRPSLKEQIFDETGGLQQSIIILLKGRNIRLEEGLDTVLGEDDYLAIFPPVAGGKGRPKTSRGRSVRPPSWYLEGSGDDLQFLRFTL